MRLISSKKKEEEEEEKIHKKPHEKEKTKNREYGRKRYKDLRDFKTMAR